MEKPNKWIARTEDWTSTTCNSCSVGCTISIGTRSGRAVIVKPDRINPVSADQICVRGRFHYDAVPDKQRLQRHLVRRGPAGIAAVPGALGRAGRATPASSSTAIIAKHGAGRRRRARLAVRHERRELPGAEAGARRHRHAARRLQRARRRTARPRRRSQAAFGTEALPADMINIARSDVVIVHRRRPRVEPQRRGAAHQGRRSSATPPRRATARCCWCRICRARWRTSPSRTAAPGCSRAPATKRPSSMRWRSAWPAKRPTCPIRATAASTARSRSCARRRTRRRVSIVYAPNPFDAARPQATAPARPRTWRSRCEGEQAAECAVRAADGGERQRRARHGRRSRSAGPGRVALAEPGMDFDAMVDAAIDGKLKAMVVVGDNPLMFAPDRARVEQALAALDVLDRHRQPADGHGEGRARRPRRRARRTPRRAPTRTPSGASNRLHAAVGALGDARPALAGAGGPGERDRRARARGRTRTPTP